MVAGAFILNYLVTIPINAQCYFTIAQRSFGGFIKHIAHKPRIIAVLLEVKQIINTKI